MRRQHEIVPSLSRLDDWIRYRVVVRDGVAITYLNGRQVHQEPLPEHHEPWLAIRSWHRFHGGARDLRILGAPVVPEQLNLLALPDLPGWAPYFDESVGNRNSDWRQRGDLPNGGGIVGRRKLEIRGSGMESLLRYHRPMLEDGTIEYEFYYCPGEAHTHPALDRLAFMLDPAGVRIHWITDGRYDRTGLDPNNVFAEPKNRRGPEQLPLKLNAWNHLQLKLTGDTVDLTLNGQLVYQRPLEPTNQRTFGLFHYADRTESRIRKMIWTGDWPKTLPSLTEQQLRGTQTDKLDARLPMPAATFEHDFATDGYSLRDFLFQTSDRRGTATLKSNGLNMKRPGTRSVNDVWLAPRIRVKGDFDVVASFEDLRLRVSDDGASAVYLIVVTADKLRSHSRVWHGLIQHPGIPRRRIAQVEYNRYPQKRLQLSHAGTLTEASDSGRFRIARRGKRMFFLLAEGDSTAFRLLHSKEVFDEPLMNAGLRLAAGSWSNGKTLGSISIVWKRLTIRAEEIIDLTVRD